MTFLAAWRLWFLAGVAALVVGYVVLQRRRSAYALRFTSPELLDTVAPRRPGFRRHLPAAVFLVSLATLVGGFARPAATTKVPRERATVIVAIDVSLSMEAADVSPNRMEAAKLAAVSFIDGLPPTLNVGVIAFARTANVLVSPTQDHLAAKAAVQALDVSESTAIGEAIFTALDALANAPVDETGTRPPARIVLLSDGKTTVGRPDAQAVEAAKAAGVPVSTIAFGTPDGVIAYDDPATAQVETAPVPVPVAEKDLRVIAEGTGGSFFTAGSLDELTAVYDDIGSAVGYEEEQREITDWFVGAALALLAVTAGLSLLWFHRLP